MPQIAPQEIPDSFFDEMASSVPATSRTELALVDNLGSPEISRPSQGWQPQKIMYWYDAIIDDMFANPGCNLKDTAKRLQRSPVTIGLVVRSDLFKARYAQRRKAFNEEIDHRITGKLVQVAEKALDFTLEAMDKKRDSIPLPLLTDIQNRALDRLGYGPRSSSAPAAVNVQVNTGDTTVSVSPEALASARDKLRLVEGRNALRIDDADGGTKIIEGNLDVL